VHDPKRVQIYECKLEIVNYEERKQNPEFENLEMQSVLDQKITSLQAELEELIDSWQKGGGDGTTG